MLMILRELGTETDRESADPTPDSRMASRESLELTLSLKGARRGSGRDAETTTGLERASEAGTSRDHRNRKRLLPKAPRHPRKRRSSTGSHDSHLATLQSKVQVVRNITIVS